MKVKLTKLPKGMKAKKNIAKAKVGQAPTEFEYLVGEDGECTVQGVNDQGAVDITTVATLTVVSADPSIVSVDPASINGMTFTEKAVAVGSTVVTVTATWNDGSVGPFSLDDPVKVSVPVPPPPGPVVGLTITHGVPVIH